MPSQNAIRVTQLFTLRHPGNSRKPIEARVKRQDLLDSVLLHHCQVYGVAGGKAPMTENNLLGALNDGTIDSQHLIDDAQQGIKRRLNGVATVKGDVAVQNLLQHFGISDQT